MINFNTRNGMTFNRLEAREPVIPELFYVNRKALRDLEVNIEYGKSHLQKIIDEYKFLSGASPTLEVIKSWFGQKKNDFLVANEGAIKKSVLSSLGKDSDESQDLSKLIEVCNQLIFIERVDSKEVMFWEVYRIESGTIELIPEEVKAIKNTYRMYATTIEEKMRLEEVRKLCAAMSNISLVNPAKLAIPGIVIYDDESGSFMPHKDFIKGYLK